MKLDRRKIVLSAPFASLALVGAAAIVWATLCPPELRPHFADPTYERLAAYGVLGFLAALAFRRQPRLAIGLVVLGAIGLEAAQLLIPGRDARITDAMVKAAGGLLGVGAGYAMFPLMRILLRVQAVKKLETDAGL